MTSLRPRQCKHPPLNRGRMPNREAAWGGAAIE